MVCMMKPNPPNMLIVTYDDIPGSMKSNKMYSYHPKFTFQGVLDKLRDLSGYHCSRPPFCRSNTANELNPKFFLIIVLLLMTLSMLQMAQAEMPPPSTVRSYQCPPNSCRIPGTPAESGGLKIRREACQKFHSGSFSVRRNCVTPELIPECSPGFTGTECNRNPVTGVAIKI